MSRVKFLFLLAALALSAFLLQAASGLILWVVLPRGGSGGGFGAGQGDATFGWDRHTWLDIHDWAGVALLVIIGVHVWVHRKWLYVQTKSLFRSR